MRPTWGVLAVAILIQGCSTDRVQPELTGLGRAFEDTRKAMAPRLAAGLERDRQAEITAAAQAGDVWTLGEGCAAQAATGVFVPDITCSLEKIRMGDRPPVVGEATALNRKMTALSVYLGALEALSDAKAEEDLNDAYLLALGALSDFGAAAELEGLSGFLAERRANREKAGAAIMSGVSALRFARMRAVVRAADPDVRRLAGEAILHVLNLNLDPGFTDRLAALRAADEAVLLTDSSDPVAYRAALAALETEHADFMEYYEGTLVYRLALVAELHHDLARVLDRPGEAKAVLSYLKRLKALSKLLRE
ncbi:hypothetical protein [Rhodovulum marinum]|uniref:Uncharacterized protein n=1 Tax=Rhodovulum marinum TaxID=320662 RepID=A0A4R2Q0W0_9RHOB|nr:hypothetical protein [Rhodovulum marinum]TCP42107.1 hypothetical protein EV662_10312 [Rhodovulum marinum]